jgi:hypothetical protein
MAATLALAADGPSQGPLSQGLDGTDWTREIGSGVSMQTTRSKSEAAMSSSTTRARWSLTGAATTLGLTGADHPGRSRASPPGSQQQHRRRHLQVAHQQPRRSPGSGHLLQVPQLAGVMTLPVGQVAGRHRDRARPDLDSGQQRAALLAAAGRGEPQVFDPLQGQPHPRGLAARPARRTTVSAAQDRCVPARQGPSGWSMPEGELTVRIRSRSDARGAEWVPCCGSPRLVATILATQALIPGTAGRV